MSARAAPYAPATAAPVGGTGSPHDGLSALDVHTHEWFVAASECARSWREAVCGCMAFACQWRRAVSHYVVIGSDSSGTASRGHNNGAGGPRTFPELWNSASASLAGRFRIARRHRGLEEIFERNEWNPSCSGGTKLPLRVRPGTVAMKSVALAYVRFPPSLHLDSIFGRLGHVAWRTAMSQPRGYDRENRYQKTRNPLRYIGTREWIRLQIPVLTNFIFVLWRLCPLLG